jgi:LPXTG-site transpeptidase (sortase) family protein
MPTPARIVIPAIGVSAPIVPLGLNPDRTLEVPRRPADAGWFVDGPEPGEQGAAVIAGHVDSRTGPAVFYRLRALRPGDRIRVVLRTGARVSFVVQSTRHVSKRRFPVDQVYRRTKRPTLRLITCDGRFDRSTHHYVDNYIVFATQPT